MNKIIGVLALVVVFGLGAFYFVNKGGSVVSTETSDLAAAVAIAGASAVQNGTYTVDTAASTLEWSAGKPLIEGYINSGTISLKEGTISVSVPIAEGAFVIDTNSIKVGLTAKKPGKEGALENHLKGKDFFNVATYPTGEFIIKEVIAASDAATSLSYTVNGSLTLKGVTHAVSFPAMIYMKDGALRAEGELELDRTKWGITFGSANFFQNLAENAISDMFTLKLALVARASEKTPTTSTETKEE